VPARICIDTCHAFAAGVDLRGEEGWSALATHLDATCGAESVALIHANDSKGCLGCKHDRHEWIGDGQIGETGFSAMFAETRLSSAAAIVEMPGDPLVKDSENVRRLKRLRAGVGGAADPLPSPS
jgi:deoxyribonuclease-4